MCKRNGLLKQENLGFMHTCHRGNFKVLWLPLLKKLETQLLSDLFQLTEIIFRGNVEDNLKHRANSLKKIALF